MQSLVLCRTAKLSSDVCDIHDSISAISMMRIWWFSRSQRSRAEVFCKERSSDVRTTARRRDLLILARVFFKVDSDMCDICDARLNISGKPKPAAHSHASARDYPGSSDWNFLSLVVHQFLTRWAKAPKKRTKAELRRSNMSNMSNTTLAKCHSLKSEGFLLQTYWM